MSAPRRWIRLDLGWQESEWLDAIDGHASGCWPRLLCYVKQTGTGGRCKAGKPAVLARLWKVESGDVERLLSAAYEHGSVVLEDGTWTLPMWATYQEPDRTSAERQRRYRADKSRLSPSRRDDRNAPLVTVGHGTSRRDPSRATETLTLTEDQKKTPRAPKRASWRFCPEDWAPKPGHLSLAAELRLQIEREVTAFREWEFKEPKTDADKAFFRWLRTSAERAGKNGNGHKPAKLHSLIRDIQQ